MKLVIVVLVLALSLLARCQTPSDIVAEFRYLDYMQEDQRCEITIAGGKKITTCGSALQTYSEFIIGGGRELFIETNQTRYGPSYPTAPGTASTSIRASFRQWQTDFGQGMGGISEYTLDGFGSNPDEIDVGNDDDWGLSPRNGNNDTDFTANGGYALYFEISTQFVFRMDISIFDNQERLLNFTLQPASVSSNVFIPYIVPFSFFEYANASGSVGQFDLTHIGALDLFAYQVANNDFGLRFLGIFGHTISGKAYLDCNTNCNQDISEPARTVVVQLTDALTGTLVDTTTTDSAGMYQFTVSDGLWRVCLRDFDSTDYSPCFTTFNSSNINCYVVNVPTVPDPSDPSIDVDLIFTDYPGNDFPFVPVSSLSDPPDTPITCADDPNNAAIVPRASISSSECGGSGSVTWTDNRIRCNPASSAGTILRTYTALFSGGGSSTTTQVITIVDQGPPSFTQPLPASTTLACVPTPCTTTACLGMAIATDDCSTPAVTSFDTPNSGTCTRVMTRTFVATDPCGPTSSAIQTITIQDNDTPTFTNFPTDRAVTCFDLANGTNLGNNPGATDPCQGTLTAGMISGPQQSSSPGACGSIMRTWTAIDGCGHSTTRTQILTVQDTQPPVIVAPAPTTITCGDSNPNLGSFSVTDNCASVPSDIITGLTVQENPGSDSCGSFVRVFTARDSCNPSVSATQVVTVVDGVPPYFVTTPPPQVTFSCQTNSVAPVLTLADDCSGVPVTAISASTTQTSGSICDQTFLRIWTGQDNCGTSTSFTQTVHLTDPDPPILTLPPTTSIACDANRSPGVANAAGTATAYDVCSDSVRPVAFTDSPSGTCTFTITRTFSASDSCMNSVTGVQILTIFDNVPPTFSSFPTNIAVPCSSSSIPVQQPTPVDNCNQITGLTFTDTPNGAACPALITITRTWSAQDSCGNPTSRNQFITLTDDAPPVATAPPSQTLPCSSGTDPSDLGTATFRLGCPALENASLVRVTFFDTRSQNSCPTTILRTWTVTDGCGQTDTDIQIITLVDNAAPVFTPSSLPPAEITVQCGEDFPPVNILFQDNCDPDPQLSTLTSTPVPGNQVGQCPADTRVTRTWTVTDNCGNSVSYSQVVTIDNTPLSPCNPVDCVPQPCDTSSCPDQNCDCCSGERLPCSPVPCSSAPCSSTPCIAVPCSGCDFPTQVTTCQPRVCPPQYIYINDDDAAAANRAGISQVKKVKNYPGVSGASNLVVSVVLLVAVLFSAILTLF